jgi:signal transduction histidine kinase
MAVMGAELPDVVSGAVWWDVLSGAGALAAAVYAWWMRRQWRLEAVERGRERRMRKELEAYTRLDVTLGQSTNGRVNQVPAAKALAMRVCRTVAEKSAFTRVMVLLRNAEGRLRCVGSIGVDDLTLAAVERWAEQVVQEEREGEGRVRALGRSSAKSVPIALGEWQQFDPEISSWEMSGRKERRKWRRAIVLPVRTGMGVGLGANAGRLVGAIVVCSDGMAVPEGDVVRSVAVERLLSPLEALAGRLGMAMENEALGERMLRAEKLAGLGQLVGGVTHALNNPLTAVLGYAELIAESSSEARVQEDARMIATEALKMKETVQRLVEFWRPVAASYEMVDVLAMVRELVSGFDGGTSAQAVKLEVMVHGAGMDGGLPKVRGCRERLRQVMEHLLNNAVQAIGETKARGAGEETHAIRVSLSHDEHTLHAIVSDTGPGFQEPGRAFDPFYTTKDPVEGAGLGLSICYGIVREHGGEIAAFNLHPHGAAVVVDLPLGAVLREEPAAEAWAEKYVHG